MDPQLTGRVKYSLCLVTSLEELEIITGESDF